MHVLVRAGSCYYKNVFHSTLHAHRQHDKKHCERKHGVLKYTSSSLYIEPHVSSAFVLSMGTFRVGKGGDIVPTNQPLKGLFTFGNDTEINKNLLGKQYNSFEKFIAF